MHVHTAMCLYSGECVKAYGFPVINATCLNMYAAICSQPFFCLLHQRKAFSLPRISTCASLVAHRIFNMCMVFTILILKSSPWAPWDSRKYICIPHHIFISALHIGITQKTLNSVNDFCFSDYTNTCSCRKREIIENFSGQ